MKGKIIIGLLLLFVFISHPVFSAGNQEKQDVSSSKLVIWSHKAEGLNLATEEYIKIYKQKYPQVEIEFEIVSEASGYFSKLITSISGGGGPDVFDINTEIAGAYNARNILVPMDLKSIGYNSVEDFSKNWAPGSLDGFKNSRGDLLGIPVSFDAWQLYVNKEYFKNAGLDPIKDAPQTWEDFYILAEKLHQKDNVGNTLVKGYQLPLGAPFGWYLIIWQPMLWQYGGNVFDENQMSALNSKATLESIKIWQNIYSNFDTGCAADYPGANPVVEFAQGGSAMTIAGPWALGTIKSISNDVYNNVTVVPLPQVDPQNPKCAFNAWGWFINKNSTNVKEATKWISGFGDRALENYKMGTGFIPHIDVVNSQTAKEMIGSEVFIEAMKFAKPREGTPYYDETGEAIKKAIDNIVLMGQDPTIVIERLHREVNRIQSGN